MGKNNNKDVKVCAQAKQGAEIKTVDDADADDDEDDDEDEDAPA